MAHSAGPLNASHRYCSVMTGCERHPCGGLLASHHQPRLCSCAVAAHAPWIRTRPAHERCSWVTRSSCFPDIVPKITNTLERFHGSGGVILHTPVLSRREPDGFYYRATLKKEVEGEKGMFLVEFYKPSTAGEKYQTFLQKTALDDIIDYSDAVQHCIVPGDKVLAPWEAELVRYGPGTVTQGIETRDPLRVSEDEEITVSFWNGKKTKVPLGVAVWIPSTLWDRIVTMIHFPLSSRQPEFAETIPSTTTHVLTDRFSTVPIHSCNVDNFHKHGWLCNLVPPHYSHPYIDCHVPIHTECSCYSHSKCNDWWHLSPTSTIHIMNKKGQGFNVMPDQRQNESERPKAKAAHFSSSSSSASSSASSSDVDSDKETCVTRSTMVDSAVNTDSSLWDKPTVKTEDHERPDWKYWKRSHPEPHRRKPGSSVSSNRFKDERFDTDSKVFTGLDLPSPGPTNQSSMFETIPQSPSRRLTMREVMAHKDFKQSPGPQDRPLVEKVGENEIEKEKQKQASIEYMRMLKLQHHDWETKREQLAEQQYTDTQEHHRKKTLQHLKNEDLKVREQVAKKIQAMKAKEAAQQKTSQQIQTLSEEDRQKEQRRLAHLQSVREKIDEKEFQKCRDVEVKELKTQEARRRRLDDHYRQMAEKVFQAETTRGEHRRKDTLEQI